MRHNFVEDDNFTTDMAFGEYIRKKRRLLGLNQKDFGNMFGVYKETISKWELGVTSPPIELARDIISHLGGRLFIVNVKDIKE